VPVVVMKPQTIKLFTGDERRNRDTSGRKRDGQTDNRERKSETGNWKPANGNCFVHLGLFTFPLNHEKSVEL